MAAERNLRATYVALFVLTLIWSTNWLVMKAALGSADPLTFNLHRTALAVLALFAVLAWQRRRFWPENWKAVLVTGFFQTTVNMGGGVLALESGGAGRTSVLVFTMPFWTLLLAWPVLGERVRGSQWIAVVAALCGMVLVVEPWSWHGSLVPKLWAVLSGLGWAVAAVLMRHYQRRHAYDPLNFVTWQMLLGALPIGLAALFTGTSGVQWSAGYVLALVFTGAISSGIGFILWLRVLQKLPAGTATLNTFAIPVLALIMSMIVFGERLSGSETVGIGAIALGLAVITMRALHAARLAAR